MVNPKTGRVPGLLSSGALGCYNPCCPLPPRHTGSAAETQQRDNFPSGVHWFILGGWPWYLTFLNRILFSLWFRLISWSACKQKIVSCSSTEAEYVAASESCREVVWLWMMLAQMHIPADSAISVFTSSFDTSTSLTATPLFCNNNGAICLAHDLQFHSHAKHIDYQHHQIHECIKSKEISLLCVDTHNNLANIFTKPLRQVFFLWFRSLLGLVSSLAWGGVCMYFIQHLLHPMTPFHGSLKWGRVLGVIHTWLLSHGCMTWTSVICPSRRWAVSYITGVPFQQLTTLQWRGYRCWCCGQDSNL